MSFTKAFGKIQPPASRQRPPSDTDPLLPPNQSASMPVTAQILLVCLILLFTGFVRVRLLDVPLERDEGEYAYMGQLLLQGIPPYSAAYNMKFPGTYLAYAGIMGLFGQTIRGIHLGFMLVNGVTILLVFRLAKKITTDTGAIIAAASYALLSLGWSLYGFAAHASHFVVLFSVGSALVLLTATEKEKASSYFLAGVLSGAALLMKQPGLFFIVFGIFYIFSYHCFSRRDRPPLTRTAVSIAVFIWGAALPLTAVLVWLFASGVFGKFWLWTVHYALQYGAGDPLSEVLSRSGHYVSRVMDDFFLLWLLSGLGFVVLMISRHALKERIFLVLYALFSLAAVLPGLKLREHYFVLLLPTVSLLISLFFDYVGAKIENRVSARWARLAGGGLFLVVVLTGIASQRDYLFMDDPVKVSRDSYDINPFPESIAVAEFIRNNSSKSDRIAVLGSEPQIYFYSQRRSATGYLYMYPLVENHDYSLPMQKEMIREIEASAPEFIVAVKIKRSWVDSVMTTGAIQQIFSWLDDYARENYELAGAVDISPDETVYTWRDDAKRYSFRSLSTMLIYQKVKK